MTNIEKINNDIQGLDSSLEAKFSFNNVIVLWRKNFPLCSYYIKSGQTEALTASPTDEIVGYFSHLCKKYLKDKYFLIELIQFEDFDFTNYWITDERQIVKAGDLEKSIIDLLVYENEGFYYPYADTDEILGVRVFSINKKGTLNQEYEVMGYHTIDWEKYIINFEKMNKKIIFKDYDESENAYKNLEII